MKECIKCHRLLDLSEFMKHSRKLPIRLRSVCKTCDNLRCRQYHHHRHANDSEWSDRKKQRDKAWRKRVNYKNKPRDALKDSAAQKVYYAVKMGKMVKPEECSMCNSTTLIEGHHEDYNKPLEVEWLCRKCHRLRHRKAV